MTFYYFSQLILNWYHIHGRKELPWQKNKTLYKVWISEIMLQQTTVKTVIPYFKKFLKIFPDIKTLSQGKLDEVLHVWSGLGYYTRAKNIYKTSQIIKKEYQGKFPEDFSKIIKLPGIGQSTAGAILSFALNAYFPILDGNIKRILIRYDGINQEITKNQMLKKLWKNISLKTPIHNTGKFNQGIIDIGALICKPKKPLCEICPLNKKCIACSKKEWFQYTIKKNQTKNITKISWFVVVQNKKKIWLEKNTTKNVWKNLFYFPSFDTKILALKWLHKNKIEKTVIKITEPKLHLFSHFKLKMYFIIVNTHHINFFINYKKIGIWYNLKDNQHIGIPAPIQKIIQTLK